MSGGNPILYNQDVVNFDPRVTATGGQKGSIIKYAPAVGAPVLLQKTDDGVSTNWSPVSGGGGGSVTGLPNTLAYYDNLGNIASIAGFVVDSAVLATAIYSGANAPILAAGSFVNVYNDGTVQSGQYSHVLGRCEVDSIHRINNAGPDTGIGTILHGVTQDLGVTVAGDRGSRLAVFNTGGTVTQNGDTAEGRALINTGSTLSIGRGSTFWGQVNDGGAVTMGSQFSFGSLSVTDAGSLVDMTGLHNFAKGVIASGGILQMGNNYCSFMGTVESLAALNYDSLVGEFVGLVSGGSTVTLNGVTPKAHGQIADAGNLAMAGNACNFQGFITGGGSIVTIGGNGSAFQGSVSGGSGVLVDDDAARIQGRFDAGSSGVVNSNGSTIVGRFLNAANVQAVGASDGTTITGYFDNSTLIVNGSLGVTFFGAISNSTVTVNPGANGAFIHGPDHEISAENSFTSGIGHTANALAEAVFGQYSEIEAGNPNAFVSTDPAHRVGGGANAGARFTAHRIDKDGRVTTRASHRDRAIRIQSGAGTINGRTDYMVLVDLTVAGASSLELPTPEDGLRFKFGSSGVGATSNYTLDAVTNGGTLDAGVPDVTNLGTINYIEIVALGGVWYRVG